MIRKHLLSGIFTLLPLVVTLWILKAIFTTLADIFRGPLTWLSHQVHVPDPPIWALALFSALATLLLLVIVGTLVSNFIGRQLLTWLVVLVEWPRPGSYTLAFVASRDCSWAVPDGQAMVAVYVPTSPNPTSGYVVMVDAATVQPVPVSADQALTWAVSGGVVVPDTSRPK